MSLLGLGLGERVVRVLWEFLYCELGLFRDTDEEVDWVNKDSQEE